MHTSSSDTHTLAESAKTQAEQAIQQVAGIRESNTINRESLEAVQRAFITFLHIEAPRFRGQDGRFYYEFMPVFQNSGVTPAKIVATSFGSRAKSEPSEAGFRGRADFTGITVGPKAIQPIGPVAREAEVSIFGFELGNNPNRFSEAKIEKNVVIWAWIAYRDVLPGTELHLTEFCDGMVGAQLNQTGVAFRSRSCGHHNCTDEDCEDYQQIMKIVSGGPKGNKHPLKLP
jgi:hypothetical protein